MALTRTDILALVVLGLGALLLIVAALAPPVPASMLLGKAGAGLVLVGAVGCILSFMFTSEP